MLGPAACQPTALSIPSHASRNRPKIAGSSAAWAIGFMYSIYSAPHTGGFRAAVCGKQRRKEAAGVAGDWQGWGDAIAQGYTRSESAAAEEAEGADVPCAQWDPRDLLRARVNDVAVRLRAGHGRRRRRRRRRADVVAARSSDSGWP